MRDVIVVGIIVASVPICFFRPYFGVLMWVWVAYFNPHRFTWGFAYDFPVSTVIAVPTLLGILFSRQVNRRIFERETLLLLLFWAWLAISYLNATHVPIFADHTYDAQIRLVAVSKALLMTFVIILLVNSKKKLDYLFIVTALSFGALAIKGTIFGVRTEGSFRVWGPPDSFVADNNDLGLALNMTLPIMFFMAREATSRWLRRFLWLSFFSSALAVILTYSRGALLGLAVVLASLSLKSRRKLVSVALLVSFGMFVVAFAPAAWTDRMDNFVHGQVDESAQGRLNAWHFALALVSQYPITGGSFETFTPELFQRFTPSLRFAGPHSIYFQTLGEQGWVGLAIFLSLLGSCFYSVRRLRARVRGRPSCEWIANYCNMIQSCLLGYIVSGAFLPRAYFDLWFQFVAATAVLKILYRQAQKLPVTDEAVSRSEPAEWEGVSVA
jgi:putative inorganic carbon (hco3(-)) transporter